MIIIYKGDATDFADLSSISIAIKTDLKLTGFTAVFSFLGVDKYFTSSEVETKNLIFSYTAAETATFPPGQSSGTFHLYDDQGRHAAVSRVLVDVRAHRPPSVKPSSVEVEIENAYDYRKLDHKPTLNGVVITGDKTSGDYHIGDSFVGVTITALTDRCKIVPIYVLDEEGTGTPPVSPLIPQPGNYVYRQDNSYKFVWDGEAWNQVKDMAGMHVTVNEDTETLIFKNAYED